MTICPAQYFDIPEIMKIERSAFIPQIQEKQKVFEERLSVFPKGFLILSDNSPETIKENRTALTAGYFCSEIWQTVPQTDDFFSLGHSAAKVHNDGGCILYASSFAILPEYRGKRLGKPFFKSSLEILCSSFPRIQTVLLLVNDEWKGAFHIYESLGFSVLRKIKEFFPSLHNIKGSDGILMTCNAETFRKTMPDFYNESYCPL